MLRLNTTYGRVSRRNVTWREFSKTSESPQWETTHCKKRREPKHLSTFRKRNQPRFRKYWRKKAEQTYKHMVTQNKVGSLTKDGDSPVFVASVFWISKTHQSVWIWGGPPSLSKYSVETDSEQVPWGKSEKNPRQGSATDPETWNGQAVKEL